ncbi:MAG: D-alanine--D-alanine ligase [Spirochaetales bacterium]|jgi:D-alanine-D-alanine ligase|nr:D-alanine--D-alanine ligase [Spirochaetales bacterium]
MKIVVLAGGLSPERDVSLSSGSLVANALAERGHQVLLADLYLGLPESFAFREAGSPEYGCAIPDAEPDLDELKRRAGNGRSLMGRNIYRACRACDVVFNALHGGAGENGQIQAFFDLTGIPYTGAGYEGCFLAMDKDLSKRLIRGEGVKTADWVSCRTGERDYPRVEGLLGYPCVVKPRDGGSSIGVSMVNNREELLLAWDQVKEPEILIEKKITGREFSVGILDNRVLPVIEIMPQEGFYNYRNKYQAGLTREVCPADLAPELTRQLGEAALKVHRTLKLGSYSRIDFILDGQDEFFCLEANTLPGMTPTSLIPQMAKAGGISYGEFCETIVRLALS